jgi:hypothetical protein
MATCVRAHCPLDLNAAPGAVRVVFFAGVRRGTIGPREWIVAVCHRGDRLFLVVGLLEFGYAFFFCSQEKNCCVPRGSHL